MRIWTPPERELWTPDREMRDRGRCDLRAPFSFMGGAPPVPPFDPATWPLTSWFQGAFASLPFAGIASVALPGPGNFGSGTISEVHATDIGDVDPVPGASLGGYASARYNNNPHNLVKSWNKYTSGPRTGSYVVGEELITVSELTVAGLLYVTAAATVDPVSSYNNGPVISQDARWGISVTSTGLGMYFYNGSTFPWHQEPISLGVWLKYCVRFGGFLGSHILQIDINGVDGTPTDMGANILVLGVTPTTGPSAFSGTTNYDFSQMDRITLPTAISDADRDLYLDSYLTARYGV